MARKYKIVLVLTLLVLVFVLLDIELARFALVGVLVGMCSWYLVGVAKTARKHAESKPGWNPALLLPLVAIVLLFALVAQFHLGLFFKMTRRMPYQYTGTIEYHRESKTWSVKDQVTFPNEKEIDQILKRARGSKEPFASSIAQMMAKDGWERELVVGSTARYTKKRDQPAKDSLYPIHTTNTIELPAFRTGPLTSSLLSNASSIEVIAPKYAVSKTYPPFKSRDDLLHDDLEALPITINTMEDAPTVRVQLVSPLLQNEWGFALSQASVWDPLKWFVLAICSVIGGSFEDEIKKALAPGAKRILARIGVKVPETPPATPTTPSPVSPPAQQPSGDAPHKEENRPPTSPDGNKSNKNPNE